jgi:hypothetical protein
MHEIKISKFGSRINDVHSHAVKGTSIWKWKQMLILLQSKGRPKFRVIKVSLGYFYCNVQSCFGYGRDIRMLRPLVLHISEGGPSA